MAPVTMPVSPEEITTGIQWGYGHLRMVLAGGEELQVEATDNPTRLLVGKLTTPA